MENQKIPIDISQAPWVECPNGNKVFEVKFLFKKVSQFLSPTKKEETIPLDIVICTRCGKVPQFFFEKAKDIPDELKSTCGAFNIQ